MKRILCLFLTYAMLFGIFLTSLNLEASYAYPIDSESITSSQNTPVISATPVPQKDFTVEIASEHKELDDNVIIPITFSNVPEKGILTFDMTIVYDPTKLEYISCDIGDIVINPETNLVVSKVYDGLIKLLFLDETLGNELITSDGIFISPIFKKLQSYNESTSIKIINSTFGDFDLNKVKAKIIQTGDDIPIPSSIVLPTSISTPKPTPTPTPIIFQFAIGSANGNTGELVTVPINFLNVPENGISTVDIEVTYNPTLLEFVSAAPGAVIPSPDQNFNYNTSSESSINIQYSKDSEIPACITSNGEFANITFKVLCKYDINTYISVRSYTFKDGDLQDVYATPRSSGTIYISGIELPSFSIEIGSVNGYANDLVTVPIYFTSIPFNYIVSFDLTLNYDPSQLEYISYEPGEILKGSDFCFGIEKISDGKLNLSYLNYIEGYIYKSGLLANLTFRVLDSAEETTVTITESSVVNRTLKRVNPIVTPGKVILLPSSSGYKVSGYVYSDLENNNISNNSFNEGFKVELSGTNLSALTDKNGHFEIRNVPAGTYSLKITKPNYLAREIKDFIVENDEELSSPIVMWIGDMEIDGVQDGAINMEDIMEICKAFNSVSGDAVYKESLDLNKDSAINLEDIMIVVKHFNKTSADY